MSGSPPGDLAGYAAADGQALTRFAYLLTGSAHDAQDLVQTVLLQLTKRGLDGIDNPEAFARRSLVNLHRSGGRRAAAHLRALTRSGRAPLEAPPASTVVEDRDALWGAMARLSSRQRAAVVLRYYEDCPDQQIAEVLGCRQATVRSLVARALATLRADLTWAGHEEDDDA
ncbi:SigE family RNA polymerase sigma factor [Nocardioides mesophilus]|uniref:SigE family RNA polymerase sigma factor n=1 Tax=Nocardioides mesophilus TaxID=433659 RepID=A0A7G9RDY1_9ACTN|nr:SigE family RNA polymerase sigma factor [Nocardioides mesophilus]QNN53806.1 SigE family RNA polymerase sigma factor [Nocardioides mesophilus]